MVKYCSLKEASLHSIFYLVINEMAHFLKVDLSMLVQVRESEVIYNYRHVGQDLEGLYIVRRVLPTNK